MEKQRVNDAVVKLGNLIIKARVFVAHRLSSKIRALRKKEDGKLGRRIERLILEISYLKTLSRSGTRKAVARKMLLSTEDHATKIERESTSPEDRAFSRLCRTKFIESFISKFREENVDWKYWVPPLLAMWEKKVEMKKTRILNPDSAETKRLSAREIAEATKRKLESSGSEDKANNFKRAKRGDEPIVEQRKKKNTAASKKFIVEPFSTAAVHKERGAKAVSKNPVGKTELNESSEDDDQSETESRSKPSSTFTENAGGTNDSADDSGENPSSPEICRVPFRPYAPKYFMANGGSENSDSEDDPDEDGVDNDQNGSGDESSDDNVEHRVGRGTRGMGEHDSELEEGENGGEEGENESEEDENESEESEDSAEALEIDSDNSGRRAVKKANPSQKKPVPPGITLKQLEKVLDKDKDSESPDQDEEESSEEEDDEEVDDDGDESTDENDSDRERKFEAKIEKKFKLNGGKNATNSIVQTYEPESSEEEFPAPPKTNNHSQKKNGDDDDGDDEDEARASSFFLRKGEQPVDIQSRTVPKEKAPGLNRRQRRGHEKQRSFNSPTQDDSEDAEPRSKMTFGKDFRSQKNSQYQDRRPGFDARKTASRQSFGPQRPGGGGSSGERLHQSERRGSLPSRFNKFSPQDGRRGSMKFSGNHKSNPREDRFDGRPRPAAAGRSEEKNRRFSERSDRTEGRSHDRRVQQGGRHDSSFSASRGSKFQDTPRPGAEEKLHPSWIAKKKLSASLNQPFQGKKIVFDD